MYILYKYAYMYDIYIYIHTRRYVYLKPPKISQLRRITEINTGVPESVQVAPPGLGGTSTDPEF